MTDSGNVREQTQMLHQFLQRHVRHILPRPFLVEILGTPSSGKTSAIKLLDTFFRRQGFRVLCPQEGAEVVRHISRQEPIYNAQTGIYALRLLIDLMHSSVYDIVIFDRCIFDAYVWAEFHKKKGRLTETEQKVLQDFFLSRLWSDAIDAAIIMTCDPAVAMRREHTTSSAEEKGHTTSEETIRNLIALHRTTYEALSSSYLQLHLVDTTLLNKKEVLSQVSSLVLDALFLKTHTRIHTEDKNCVC